MTKLERCHGRVWVWQKQSWQENNDTAGLTKRLVKPLDKLNKNKIKKKSNVFIGWRQRWN